MVKRKLLYIGGYGRSGSTLLDILLSNAESCIGLGEIQNLSNYLDVGGIRCSCGEDFEACAFWSKVFAIYEANDIYARQNLVKLQDKQGWSRLLRYGFRMRSKQTESTLRYFYEALFKAAKNSENVQVIIESSKSSHDSVARPLILASECGLDVTILHLVRDPRAVVYSILRGSNQKIEAGQEAQIPFGTVRALLGWCMANLGCYIAGRLLGKGRYMLVRYEDLIEHPTDVLKKVGKNVGLDVGPVLRIISQSTLLEVGHHVGGNRMIRSGTVRLRGDIEWQQSMSWIKKLAIWCFVFPYALLFRYSPLPDINHSEKGRYRPSSHN